MILNKKRAMRPNKPKTRLLTFLLSVITASAAVAFAAFSKQYFLLAVVLVPCILAFALSIVPTNIPPKIMMALGVISFLASIGVIAYVLIFDLPAVRPYIDFLFNG